MENAHLENDRKITDRKQIQEMKEWKMHDMENEKSNI